MKNRFLFFLMLMLLGGLDAMHSVSTGTGLMAQRIRTTAVFDADTTTRPKAGFYGVGVRSGNVFLVKPTGNTERLVAANTHVGTSGHFLFTNGSINRWKSITISNVASLQSSLDAKLNTPSGLTTDFLTKWNGSAFVNSNIFTDGTTLSSNSPLFLVGGSFPLMKLNGSHPGSVLYSIRSYIVGVSNGGFEIYDDSNSQPRLTIMPAGNVGIGSNNPTSKLQVVGLPTYADNAAATSAGLTAGAFYRTSTGVLMVVY